jgi:hypothetical protein
MLVFTEKVFALLRVAVPDFHAISELLGNGVAISVTFVPGEKYPRLQPPLLCGDQDTVPSAAFEDDMLKGMQLLNVATTEAGASAMLKDCKLKAPDRSPLKPINCAPPMPLAKMVTTVPDVYKPLLQLPLQMGDAVIAPVPVEERVKG